MKKLFPLFFILLFSNLFAQSYNDGCMDIRIVATRAWNEEYEDPIANDETDWQWWFADVGDFDATGWAGGNCLAQSGFFQIGWWNHPDQTIFNNFYGAAGSNSSPVPVSFNLRGHFEGNDCGGTCDYCTSNPFDNDDYQYDQVVSTGINYRFGPPNSNNFFQRFTTNNGSSDFGGEFYTRYTSPRPNVTTSTTQICSGVVTPVTLNFSGAIFGGAYQVFDGATLVYSGTASSTVVNISTSKTYRVFTRNGGVNSSCYALVQIVAANCDYNCVTSTSTAWNASFDASDGISPQVSYTSPGDFPSNSYITDVDVSISFIKTDGTCASPSTGLSFHSETVFELDNSTIGSVSLVDREFVGSTALVAPLTITFDEDATTPVSGHNVTNASNGISLDPTDNLDFFNNNLISNSSNWSIYGGDAVGLDPLCTYGYQLNVCGCKTANNGLAAVNGSTSPITICGGGGSTIVLSHNGATSGAMSENGYGEELRWYTGSCGGTYIGSGLTLTVPSPNVATTYYASFYENGVPCRGSNSYCESISVNITPPTVAGSITPSTQTICQGSSPTNLILSGFTGAVLGWQYSSDGATWVSASGTSTNPNFSPAAYANIVGSHFFRAAVQNGACNVEFTSLVELIVNPNPVSGTISSTLSQVCTGETYTLNANGNTGNIQWQVSTTNATTGFANVVGANSPSLAESITNTGNTPISRWYRIAVTNPPCAPTAFSNVVEVIINPTTVPGSINGPNDSICVNTNVGVLSLTGYVGSVTSWEVSVNGAPYTNIVNTNDTYSPGVLSTIGTYDYRAIVRSGTCDPDTTLPFRVQVIPSITASISGIDTICSGDSVTLTATAAGGTGVYSYQWLRGGVTVGTNAPTLNTSAALGAGNYSYSVIVSSGPCSVSSPVHLLTVLPNPTISNVTVINLTCFEDNSGSINVTSSADSFSIDGGLTYQLSNTFSGLSAGSYDLFVKNNTGCISEYTSNPISVTQPDSISIGLTATQPNCLTSNDGEIAIVATGGTPGFEYAINGAAYQSGSFFTGLAPGSYSISVRDSRGCINTSSITLTAQYTFNIVADSIKNISCTGSVDGFVEIGTVGGVAPFSFSQDNSTFVPDSVFNNLAAGNYTFYAQDDNGCTANTSVSLIEQPPIQIDLDSVNQILCNGDNTGAIFVTASGSTPNYSYEWRLNGSVISTNEDISGLSAGTYNLTVSTSSSCTENIDVTLVEPSPINISITSQSDASCSGNTDGNVQVSVTGGTPSYSYSWEDGSSNVIASTQNLSNVGADSYVLTVTDANGCTATLNATVNEPTGLSMSTAAVDPSCSNSNDGSLTITATGGTAPYSYRINGGSFQGNNVFTSLVAGVYSVEVEDGNGCIATDNVTLTDQYSFSISVSSQTNVSCAGQNDGTVTLSNTGGQAPISYTINGTNAQASGLFTGLGAGLYTFEAMDANGCTAVVSTTITENPPMVLSLDSTREVSCNGQNTGAIYVSTVGGATPYSYSINGGAGQATGTFTGLTAGSYNVIVTDDNGCTQNVSVNISEPTPLSVSITSQSDASCSGNTDGNVQVSVTGGTPSYSYSWVDGGSNVIASTQNLSNVGADSYVLTVTDANGCTATLNATVNEPTGLSMSTAAVDPSCSNSNDGSLTITATGGTAPYSYRINGGSFQGNNVFTSLVAGVYSVEVEDGNGCIATDNVTLTDQYSFSITVSSQTNVSCAGQNDGTVTLSNTGGQAPISYTINGTNAQASGLFTGLGAGLYTFEAMDANGCTAVVSTTITENPPMVLSLDSTREVSCNGQNTGAIYVSTVGGATPYSYSINGGAGQATGTFTGLTAGSYNVIVTDDNGCTQNVSVNISEPTPLSVSITSQSDASCSGNTDGNVQVSVTGGTPSYSYSWVDGSSNVIASTQNLSNVGADTYVLTVTDANGCTATLNAIVNEPTGLSVSTAAVDPSCSNSNDGSLTITATGGTAPYSYRINGGSFQGNNVFTSLVAGVYSVEVEDGNGCIATDNVTLTDQYSFSITVSSQTNVSCAGQNDGTVTLSNTGGQAPISYTINGTNAQASGLFTGLGAGLYTFEAMDANGCTAVVSTTITENPPLVILVDSIINETCGGTNSGGIYVSVSGGDGSYTYSWSNSTGLEDLENVNGGTYTLVVTDGAGCSVSTTETISSPTRLSLVIANFDNVSCNGEEDGYVDVSVAGGTAPYTFLWNNGETTEDIYNIGPGTYTITVTDANGCSEVISQVITEPTVLTANITTTDVACFGDNTGTAIINASGGSAPYTYLWNTFDTTQSLSGMGAGLVSVIVTDNNGCQITLTDTINGPASALQIDLIRFSNVSCFGGNNGEIITSVSGGTAPYTINWTPGGMDTEIISGLTAGVYTIEVTDANGCIETASYTITQPSEIISTVSVTNPGCANDETGIALVGVSGGTLPYTYSWNTTPVQAGALANNLAGDTSYVVEITDRNGCLAYDTAVLVDPIPMEVSTTTQGVTCESNNNGEVAVIVTNGNAPYTYQLNGFMQTDSIFENLEEGTYVVTAIDQNDCTASAQFDINTLATLEIALQGAGLDNIFTSDDIFIVRGEEVNLQVDVINSGVGVSAINWNPNSGENAVDTTDCIAQPCLTASIQPVDDITVIATAIDTNGCETIDTLRINVSQDPLIFMPTAFSPNGDCLNDYFEVNILGATNLDVTIFNRWGEKVFSNPNQTNGLADPDDMFDECTSGNLNPRNAWDGTFNGELAPNGTYVYQIEVTLFNGEKTTMNGTLTLIR